MIGNQDILEYFENCRRNNTLAHAYSLIGPTSSGHKKAVIIESAEKMNEASQNAFLKVLEEPTPNTYLSLLVGHKHLLLPTIFSRTAPLYFSSSSAAAPAGNLLQP